MPASATGEASLAVHLLAGLEPDNLLAFLSLLGLLRALEESTPKWNPRAAWRGVPLRAELYLAEAVSRTSLVAATIAGIHKVAQAYDVLGETTSEPLKRCSKSCNAIPDSVFFELGNFRALSERYHLDRARGQLLASLGSDGVAKRNGVEVATSPLRLLFGQGHQHYPSRLHLIATQARHEDEKELEQALFEPWTYSDSSDGFRWDPNEDRRYAYQAGDPSESRNKVGTVAGANRLASIGVGLLCGVPTHRGLIVLGFQEQQLPEMCWPLVEVPTTLAGHIAVMSHPALLAQEPSGLRAYGVKAIARSRRVQVGKFFNFERARLDFLVKPVMASGPR